MFSFSIWHRHCTVLGCIQCTARLIEKHVQPLTLFLLVPSFNALLMPPDDFRVVHQVHVIVDALILGDVVSAAGSEQSFCLLFNFQRRENDGMNQPSKINRTPKSAIKLRLFCNSLSFHQQNLPFAVSEMSRQIRYYLTLFLLAEIIALIVINSQTRFKPFQMYL